MSRRREQRPPSRREKRAIRAIEIEQKAVFDAYPCPDPYAVPEGISPTLEEMLETGEGQLPDR